MKKDYMTRHLWTKAEDKYIKSTTVKDREKLLRMFNKKFNCNITIHALVNRLHKYGKLNNGSDFTPEMCQWLIDNYRVTCGSVQKLTDAFNKKFNTTKTKSSIWHKAFRLFGARSNEHVRRRLIWTAEMEDVVRELNYCWSHKYIAKKLTEMFNYEFTASMVEHKANRLGLYKNPAGYGNKDGRLSHAWFGKDHISWNKVPVGTILINKSGEKQYKRIKVAEPDKWEFLHRYVWKEHHGEIPEGCMITFLDGDTLNCDIENLECITPGENAVLNGRKLRCKDIDMTRIGLDIAKIKLSIGRKRK